MSVKAGNTVYIRYNTDLVNAINIVYNLGSMVIERHDWGVRVPPGVVVYQGDLNARQIFDFRKNIL
jgi:hypothetical protein